MPAKRRKLRGASVNQPGKSAGTEQVVLLNLQKDNIMVAEYWTELPPKAVLEEQLHTAWIEIRERLAEQKRIAKT